MHTEFSQIHMNEEYRDGGKFSNVFWIKKEQIEDKLQKLIDKWSVNAFFQSS